MAFSSPVLKLSSPRTSLFVVAARRISGSNLYEVLSVSGAGLKSACFSSRRMLKVVVEVMERKVLRRTGILLAKSLKVPVTVMSGQTTEVSLGVRARNRVYSRVYLRLKDIPRSSHGTVRPVPASQLRLTPWLKREVVGRLGSGGIRKS